MADRANGILVSVLFLSLLSGCGGGGGGGDMIPPFTLRNAVATGDMNGDGLQDLALATAYIAGPPPHPGRVSVYLQNPSRPGSFAPAVHYDVGSDPWQIAVADLNRDGPLDIVVANTGSNDVSVLLHDPSPSGGFLPAVRYPCGTYTNFVATGDMNGDGLPDIAAAFTGGVCILFQDRSNPGTFLQAARLSTSAATSAVAIGDLNGDGFPDLVAISSATILVFIQDAAAPGTFLPVVAYPAGLRASSVAIQDLNADSLPDLAVVHAGDSSSGGNSTIMIRLQNPSTPGQFPDARYYASANGSRTIAVGDLNGDGRPDLAVAAVVYSSQSPGVVQLFLQDAGSPGTFLTPVSYGAGNTPQSIAIADLNGDGRPDLAGNDGPVLLFQDPTTPGTFFNAVVP